LEFSLVLSESLARHRQPVQITKMAMAFVAILAATKSHESHLAVSIYPSAAPTQIKSR
jgi:hypothetical protein